jgi:hypothetical protein
VRRTPDRVLRGRLEMVRGAKRAASLARAEVKFF